MAKFVYPYNFVPPAKQELGKKKSYKPLNRQHGKTGRIEFTLTNLSPLFIPDAEQTTHYHITDERDNLLYDDNNQPKYHRIMDFFNVKGNLAIPGTALKGMFRSVVEALSNSTFGVFTPEDKPYTFRKINDLGSDKLRVRKWGRWLGNGEIEEMENAKIWRPAFDTAFGLTTMPRDKHNYNHLVKAPINVEVWQLHTGNKHVQSFNNSSYSGSAFNKTIKNSGTGTLKLRQHRKTEIIINRHSIKGPHFNNIRKSLGLNGNGPWNNVGYKTVDGVLNAKNGKSEERICELTVNGKTWNAKSNSIINSAILWPHQGWDNLEIAERKNINYLAALYPTGKKYNVPEKVYKNYQLANKPASPNPGDIVRFRSEGQNVVEFGPVAMFKTPEQATVKEITARTTSILPCQTNIALCTASRLFGWTPENEKGKDNKYFPVAGRVRVGVAWSDKKLDETILIPLQTLGSPKPEYYPFYLRPENGNPSSEPGYYTTQTGSWWHQAGLLRGRKFYLHHPNALYNPKVSNRNTKAPDSSDKACQNVRITPAMDKTAQQKKQEGKKLVPEDLRSHQNATAAVLPPGKKFKGYIEFDSLDDYELGLLLWAISLSDLPLEGCPERAHKLGMGRPIGMGSVQAKIESIVTYDPMGGWADASASGEMKIDTDEANRLVKSFKTWMISGEDIPEEEKIEEFNQQEFYKELCAVLSLYLAGKDPVQYHPPNINAYEGYKYFVEERKKRNHCNNQKEQTLQTLSDLKSGNRQHYP